MTKSNVNKDQQRLDKFLVDAGWVRSRHRAEMLIKEHGVLVNQKLVKKTGHRLTCNDNVELIQEDFKWVSRGAFKLIAALDQWSIDPSKLWCLDVGASTGGFTQVLLDRGAQHVYAVDTGTAQLDSMLKTDARVTSMEETNITSIKTALFKQQIDLAVVDVSFVSLSRIISSLVELVKNGGMVVTLFKPQFEVGRDHVGKNGIVRNEPAVAIAKKNIHLCATSEGMHFQDEIMSPVKGGDGNTEYLMLWKIKR